VFCWRHQLLRFVDFYGTRSFIIVFTVRQWTLSSASLMYSTPFYSISFISTLSLYSEVIPSRQISNENSHEFLIPTRKHTLPHIVFCNVAALILIVKWLQSSLMWTFHKAPVNVPLLGPKGPTIHLSASSSPLRTLYMVSVKILIVYGVYRTYVLVIQCV
jgi:hypothetical protein